MSEVEKEVKSIIAKILELEEDQITADANLRELGLDSMGYLVLASICERSFSIRIVEADIQEVRTVDDLVNCIKRKQRS